MRIACKHYEGINLPCYNNGTGEYEDYPIYIHGGVEKYTWSPSSNFASFYGDSVLVQSIGSTTSISVNTLYDNNCHSSTSKIIYVKDSSLHLFVDTICSNQLPYLWQGDTILNSGTYSKQFTNALGCDSTFVLNLQVNEADTILVNDTICSAQLPFVWQGQSLSGSGVYSVIFQNQHGCDSLIRLLLTVNPSDTTTILDTVCSNQLPYMWQGQQITSSGLYSTTLQNALGCDSLLNLNLTVHPSFNSIQYDTICSNDLPFYWQEHFITSAGFYADTLQSVMQCDSILSLNLIVYDNYIGQLRQDGNRLFCPLKNLHNYNWFFNGRLLKNTDTSLLITESGNYELQAWSAEGCMIKFTTTVLEESFTSMHVYPNPAHTIFYIDFDLYLPSVVYLKLTDVTGNVIKVVSSASKLQPGRQRMEFDLTDLDMTNGIYFLERNDDTGSWIEKVSIVK